MCACSLLSKDQLLANISMRCLNSPSRIKFWALGAWLGGENRIGLWWKHGLEHGNLQDHFVQSFLVDICCFAHIVSFRCLSGRSPISYGELISCDLNGADLAPISQEWVLTHVWPIRGLHILIHSDWFRAGHMTQARPVRVFPGSLIWSCEFTGGTIHCIVTVGSWWPSGFSCREVLLEIQREISDWILWVMPEINLFLDMSGI